MHTKSFDAYFVAQLIQMGIIGAVLGRLARSPVDEDKIVHNKCRFCSCVSVDVLQLLREDFRSLLVLGVLVDRLQDFVSKIGQRNGSVAVLCLRRSCPPILLLVPKLERLVDGQCPIFPVDSIPGQSNQLSGTKSCFQDQSVLIVVVRSLGDLQELFLLFNG